MATTTAALSARPRITFRSWDRIFLPLPFARVVCCYGEPLHVPEDARGDALERLRAELDTRLDALTSAADTALGWTGEPSGAHRAK